MISSGGQGREFISDLAVKRSYLTILTKLSNLSTTMTTIDRLDGEGTKSADVTVEARAYVVS